jgi:hypothetical protein
MGSVVGANNVAEHVHSIGQAAQKVGIAESLLQLWIETKRIVPSIELSTASVDFEKYPALKTFAGESKELLGWNRFAFSDEDIERLRFIVRRTDKARAKKQAEHIKGSHYTVHELATIWGLGVDKIRELFSDEQGVIKIQRPKRRGRRSYATLRIPEAVADRVQRRTSNA